jgi:hypothetical protein
MLPILVQASLIRSSRTYRLRDAQGALGGALPRVSTGRKGLQSRDASAHQKEHLRHDRIACRSRRSILRKACAEGVSVE